MVSFGPFIKKFYQQKGMPTIHQREKLVRLGRKEFPSLTNGKDWCALRSFPDVSLPMSPLSGSVI